MVTAVSLVPPQSTSDLSSAEMVPPSPWAEAHTQGVVLSRRPPHCSWQGEESER